MTPVGTSNAAVNTNSNSNSKTATLSTILARVLLLLTLGFTLSSCDQNTQDTIAEKPNKTPSTTLVDPLLAEALKHYQHAQIHTLHTTSSCVETLSTNIDRFLTTPTQPLLNENQLALQHCLDLYIPVHTLIQSNSNQALQTLTAPLTKSVYSTPILPGYVDYLLQYPNSGIVNDITLALSEQTLRDQQGLTDSGEISIGFEVIAFILMGEQRYNQSLAPRPVIDFKEPDASRRRQYLTITVSLLQQDLTVLQTVLEDAMARTQQRVQQKAQQNSQQAALQTIKNILNTMLVNIEQQSFDSLSMGYWALLKYSAPQNGTGEISNEPSKGSTLATYLKWPQETPDLSREAFTAQLKASLQRLQ
jgi:putative iron-regulated protein